MTNTTLLVDKIIAGMREKKARDITVVDLSAIADTICRAFVICTGGSPSQVQAIAHSVGDAAHEGAGAKPTAVDGLRNAQWVAMDYSDVIVHILLPDERAYYDIEHLWADAALTELPNED